MHRADDGAAGTRTRTGWRGEQAEEERSRHALGMEAAGCVAGPRDRAAKEKEKNERQLAPALRRF